MKKYYYVALSALLLLMGVSACSSDDVNDEIEDTGSMIGRWKFVEMLDGQPWWPQPESHTLEIKSDGTVIYSQKKSQYYGELREATAEEKTDGYFYPLIYITVSAEDGVARSTPYLVNLVGNTLNLHYAGIYTTDHIPETYVYQRIK